MSTGTFKKPDKLIRMELDKLRGRQINFSLVFRDPYFLDFGAKGLHFKRIWATILRDMEAFILELERVFVYGSPKTHY